MTSKIIPVIMAGGKGTRLWPLSRATAPKQFIQFVGDRTLFQATLARVSDPAVYEPPMVITNDDFRFLAAEQAREAGVAPSAMLLEPVARNTAAAVAAAAAFVAEKFGEDALILVLASDHEIVAGPDYAEAIAIAAKTAASGKLVTFGITPIEPATGYGYIEIGDKLATGAAKVKRFVEKPVLAEAEKMLSAGGFAWNSGIFMFKASQVLQELGVHAPDVELPRLPAISTSCGSALRLLQQAPTSRSTMR
jgi:mannose-1-phosphate guanylyltransferase